MCEGLFLLVRCPVSKMSLQALSIYFVQMPFQFTHTCDLSYTVESLNSLSLI